MKIVINKCYGGFSLSRAALHELRRMGNAHALSETDIGERYSDSFCRDIPRDDPQLIDLVTRMGIAANGECAALEVVEIPDGVEWTIEEYDGREWIAEVHRTWS